MVKATRAYDVLLQLRPGSRTMDVRQHSMWAIGAELLMRQCENEPSQDKNGEESSSTPTPTPEISRGRGLPSWGQPTNLDRVKAYFEALIQQHPYDHKFPRNVSALEFHLALLGCEIYNIHAEQQSALARLPVHAEPACRNPQPSPAGNPENAQTRVPGLEPRDFAGHAEGPDGESNVNPFEDSIRKQALAGMRDISDRMDSLMQELPYRKNNQFLRLRATAALYMADLLVPPSSQITGANHHEARRQQRQVAIDALKRLAENGGALDSIAQDILDGQEDEEEGLPSPPARCLSLTLPIRGP
ncbi:hypothetical protein RJ55_05876 [Drechmeria coniospora]|nr:hypothetical protein RJ55_05876 [Drechmeria coniospora]